MAYPHLIDNIRKNLGDTLRDIAPNYKKISLATGYWDLPGTAELIEILKDYDSIRLLIGQEPLSYRYQKIMKLDYKKVDEMFPDEDFKSDLENDAKDKNVTSLRNTVVTLAELIEQGKLEVKVFRKTMLHAKAYIFGDYSSDDAIGIVGSSNFTKAGLGKNTELNALEDDYRIVTYTPTSAGQENGYLSWFDSLWNDEAAIEWTGDFKQILQNSPVGDMTYGPYDTYIKTLMEVYPEEIAPQETLEEETSDILFSFQNRNAGILINKLANNGVAILADSVGLGKTITGGAVIKHYLNKSNGDANVLIIAPAALKQQWKDDLSSVLGIDYMSGDYQIVSQQDGNAIHNIYEEYAKNWRRHKKIDLFVIDEAHNLRSNAGQRHDTILELLQQHPNAHVLLLTATPINNSLMDIANIIQIASKGKLTSVNVSYARPDGSGTELLDFYVALKRIQTEIRKAEKAGEDVEKLLEKVKPTIHEGLRHYLVRSTRQGVEAEGGIVDKKTGQKKEFPKSAVSSIKYEYDKKITDYFYNAIGDHVTNTFEGIDPRLVNLTYMSEITQRTSHPLDFLNEILMDEDKIYERLPINNDLGEQKLYLESPVKNLVQNVLQLIFVMGFTPYRPELYQHKYWNKTIEEISDLKDVSQDIKVQLAVHNVLQVTWLKRMESSAAALLYSVINYEKRMQLFEKYLNKGFIVNLMDANLLESDYNNGEDIDQAFKDYEKYLKEKEKWLDEGKNPDELKKYGVEKKKADPKIYNIKQLQADLVRETKIISLLKETLNEVIKPEYDSKAQHLCEEIKNTLALGKYGKKVIVFSFFADTIKYLQSNAKELFESIDADFEEHSAYISGQSGEVEKQVKKFSPKSKKYTFAAGEEELNFLFATDVLSEGQNLQDAGYLINYDLHWNPVRMIQRNGRINRLGSSYDEVLISNMRPIDDLEIYLNLVHRLEGKIKTIRNTIGLDQGVLSTKDVNPIEFIEKYYTDGALPDDEDDLLAHTDDHIIELRKFIAANPKDSKEYLRVKNMPLGKWNYMPDSTTYTDDSLALMKVYGSQGEDKKEFTNIFFIDVTHKNGDMVATYIDYVKALNYLKTVADDNQRKKDNISIDRLKVSKRASAEAKRQADNPVGMYNITPQYQKALNTIAPYVMGSIPFDIQRTIQLGVTTTDLKKSLETNLRQINKEQSENGSVYSTTIVDFTKVINEIYENIGDEKSIDEVEGALYYAR